MCPHCEKSAYCGCKSCNPRKGLNPKRSEKLRGDFIICPYCRIKSHVDTVETFNYKKLWKN